MQDLHSALLNLVLRHISLVYGDIGAYISIVIATIAQLLLRWPRTGAEFTFWLSSGGGRSTCVNGLCFGNLCEYHHHSCRKLDFLGYILEQTADGSIFNHFDM